MDLRVRNSFARVIRYLKGEKALNHHVVTRDTLLSKVQNNPKGTPEVIEAISGLADEFNVDEAIDFLTYHRLNVFNEAEWNAWVNEQRSMQ